MPRVDVDNTVCRAHSPRMFYGLGRNMRFVLHGPTSIITREGTTTWSSNHIERIYVVSSHPSVRAQI